VLNQSQYLKDKLEEFSEYDGTGGASTPLPLDVQTKLQQAEKEEHEDSKFPYRQIVGSLMYAMLGTRPDLAVAVSIVCKFLEKPKPTHIKLPLPLDVQTKLQQAEKEEHEDSKFPYRQIVGSLMYAMLGTRPDLAVAVSIVCKFLEKPKPTHIKLVQHILQYLRVNLNLNLSYQPHGPIKLTCYMMLPMPMR
jgi:hypothetical protein